MQTKIVTQGGGKIEGRSRDGNVKWEGRGMKILSNVGSKRDIAKPERCTCLAQMYLYHSESMSATHYHLSGWSRLFLAGLLFTRVVTMYMWGVIIEPQIL